MSLFSRMSFRYKLVLGAAGMVAVSIVLLTGALLWQVQASLETLGQTSMKAFAESIYSMMEMQHNLLADKVRTDLNLMEEAIQAEGAPWLNLEDTVSVTLVNQITKEKESATIPSLEFGTRKVFQNYDLVDSVQAKVGGTATIFQVLPGKLLRISTNVKKLDGQRAVGTYIPDTSPVYKTIMKGETYYGIAYVVNAWYQTAYKPLKDWKGNIVGVIYVGRRILTPEFHKAVEAAKIGGKGYGFIYNDKSVFTLHPSLEGRKLSEYPAWEFFKGVTHGVVRYDFQGEDKAVFLRYFEPWGWYYGFSMTAHEMMHGVDVKVMTTGGIIAAVAVLVASLVIFIMINLLVRPLRQLVDFSNEAAKGNYDATIDYAVDDGIGKTIHAVQDMTREMKIKLGMSQGLLMGLTQPCIVVDLDERITFINQQELDLLQMEGEPSDFIGMKMSEFLYGDASRTTGLTECLTSGEACIGVPSSGTSRKGREYHVLVDSAPLKDLDGKLIGAFTILTETTELKQSEQRAMQQHEAIVTVARDSETIAEQLSSAADELAAQVEQAARGSEVQRERVAETATAMEQMNATVLEVARNASDAAENADSMREMASEGGSLVEEVVSSIRQVEERSEQLKASMADLDRQADGIGAIMQVIEDIADQTNLLALNAAIEAARAGEAGRGFAVVADEVRKLAEKTMDATKQVGSAVHEIQSGARQNVRATDDAVGAVQKSTELAIKAGQAMQEIQNVVDQSAQQVSSIATAAEEQSATSDEVNRATDEINIISSETATAMHESSKAIEDLARLANELKELIGRMQTGD
ncbi:methyl-accepting chemotaxis protein [Pseudodesulfovibrio tunisiensis]|uniref:methyl-accepting chemotaxis protein n=1 Tax=Pseudodesulfovibrio tunisiensis TaxID=463192 RepID=UPI001FB468DB|nr:Cache 3/Cache 2 fusion domain-containing protein [Pseudodesulfovibrio tunisiensis]